MKLFSWLNDISSPSFQESTGEDAEPSLSPVLQERLVELEKLRVKEVMVPRALITALDADVQLRRVRRLKSAKVVHFPVYKGDLDHILGWISKQKVLELLAENAEENPVAQHVRPVGVVSEEAPVSALADMFLKSASPFLVAKNTQGATTGIVSLAEFVELIFGFELTPNSAPQTSSETPAAIQSFDV